MIISIPITCNCQKLSKTDKAIITTIGASVTAYGFLSDTKDAKITCISGVLFAAIPYIFEGWKNIEVSSSGINIKLKFKKFKCYKSPYKNKAYER